MSPKGPGLCENHYRPLTAAWQLTAGKHGLQLLLAFSLDKAFDFR
jgi:hypothetical protein